VIRKSYAALRNLINPLPHPNPMLSGQVESESKKTGSDPHHWLPTGHLYLFIIYFFFWGGGLKGSTVSFREYAYIMEVCIRKHEIWSKEVL
jgi:hypothetical protein